MITIRSAEGATEPTLVRIEATLTIDNSIYSLTSNQPLLDGATPLADGLFGAIAWPRSRFRIASDFVLDQQILLSHENFAAAFCWQLCGGAEMRVRLQVRPWFAGCCPRSYRDVGFRFQSPEEGGRLTWLPSVLGPRIIADTNGVYADENSFDRNLSPGGNLVSAGAFDFELSHRPSVLILTNDRLDGLCSGHLIGTFLAGLAPDNCHAAGACLPAVNTAASLLAA